MLTPQRLQGALDRIEAGAYTQEDLETLKLAYRLGLLNLATGNRSVDLGGDANDTIIITGDRNIVLQGTNAENIEVLINILKSILENSSNINNTELDARSKILQKVYRHWVKGIIENDNFIYNIAPIKLDFKYKPDSVIYPWEEVVQESNPFYRDVDSNLGIAEIFDDLNGELLILGQAGSGKTTMLVELARTLILRAQEDDTLPIPIIFPLSLWSQKPIQFHDWLIFQLGQSYNCPIQFSQKWIENNQLLLLLDGLDEVEREIYPNCVEAINNFRSNYGFSGLVVSSRSEDYNILNYKLKLEGAIEIQPLTSTKVDTFLSQSGEQIDTLRQTLDHDIELRELTKIPLMLNIMVMVYRKASMSNFSISSSRDKQTTLWEKYVENMFTRRSKNNPYSSEKTVRWLTWLAKQMSKRNQTIFYIENLKSDWLELEQQKVHKRFSNLLLKTLLSFTTAFSLSRYFGIRIGVFYGVLIFFLYKVSFEYEQIKIIGTLGWEWSAVKHNFLRIFKSQITWLITIVFFSFFSNRSPLTTLNIGLILTILSGMNAIVISGIKGKNIEEIDRPNLGIFKSAFNGVLVGTINGCFMGLSGFLLALISNRILGENFSYSECFIIWAFYGFITGWLQYGGLTSFQHFTLRLILWMDKLSPWNYAHFLSYATRRFFMYQVGGGYMFIHRLPMYYFASLKQENSPKKEHFFLRWSFKYSLLPNLIIFMGLLLAIPKVTSSMLEEYNLENLEKNIKKREYDQAIDNSQKILEKNPKNKKAILYRGIAKKNLGYYQQAVSDFDEVISFSHISQILKLEARANRGLSHILLKNYNLALDDLNYTVQESRSNSIYKGKQLINRAFLQNDLGNYNSALDDSSQAIELLESKDKLSNAYALLNKGRAYAGLENYKDAKHYYDTIIMVTNKFGNHYSSDSLSSLLVYTFSYRAYTLGKLGNYNQANKDCKKSIEIGNKFELITKQQKAISYNYCGLVSSIYNDHFQAIKYYDQAIQLEPQFADAFEYRGIAYLQINNRKLAINDLKSAGEIYKKQGNYNGHQRTINIIADIHE